MNELVKIEGGHEYRQSTDAAGLCGAIVKQTARNIQGRRFVSVEGWQAIAIAHGCAASACDVEKVDGGVRATGEVRRMSDGQLIARGEGFVGEDEPTWYGGQSRGKTLPKRADYAIRAMAQTRAISRACRSAFAHVVVMIDAGLSTTPAEEVPEGGFVEGQFQEVQSAQDRPANTLRTQLEQSVAEVHHDDTAVPPGKREPAHSALKTAIRGFVHEMEGCGDWDEWCVIRDRADNQKIIAECQAKLPQWWLGWDEQPDGFTPLVERIEAKEKELAKLIGQYAGT